ncbi:hypothetical protein [Achromobacter denitrificans]|uniref:hypothetical protein n=1 Tax=Achromobacter denitrificans TaxID=32002 RepID=UPI000F67BA27|nr:hypothetical protein [Achromobacter denitrificans]MDF3939406.1 hypothetical protein [Achromobacter denitrificans]RSE79678.1 hypothetical protein EGU64_22670 [Achromobacter denitrificans]
MVTRRLQIPVLAPKPNRNFFDGTRPGAPVLRPADLLALRIELRNLAVSPGQPPRLKKAGDGPATLIVHFPPQSIVEQTFFETAAAGTTKQPPPRPTPEAPDPGGGQDALTGPPVRARIAGESRLAFSVPDDFDAPYTLEGVLAAIESLPPAVAANARPPAAAAPRLTLRDLFDRRLDKLAPAQRAALSSFALRNARIATQQDAPGALLLRLAGGGPGLRVPRPGAVIRPVERAGGLVEILRRGPKPAPPTAQQTAIELPWRLILSPHAEERWRHAKSPATSAATQHTELWHSRLLTAPGENAGIEPPAADARRTLRAIWALGGESTTKPMQAAFPVPADTQLPKPDNWPFRMPMTDFDRYQIAHLSSNFSVANYTPQPVDARLLMLSALGAWLDSRGNWDAPGLSLEEWTHRGAMGRDHFVRIVYKGFLFPFGHRASLVKVSERKFHPGTAGNTAYLRQRLFIIVRQRERVYADPDLQARDGGDPIFLHRQMPFSSVRILTAVTPSLDRPTDAACNIDNMGQLLFWPCVAGAPFKFACSATDIDGRSVQFDLPMIFMDGGYASPREQRGLWLAPSYGAAETFAVKTQTAWRKPERSDRRIALLKQQRVTLAPSRKAGDTAAQVDSIEFDAVVEPGNAQLRAYSDSLNGPLFYPGIRRASIRIAALSKLTGSDKTSTLSWNAHYLKFGFDAANAGQVFGDIDADPIHRGGAALDFSSQGDRAGGFVQPNLRPTALSRLAGPVSGKVEEFVAGRMSGEDVFPKTLSDLPLPLLFGCIPLGEVIEAVADAAGKPEQVPRFVSEACSQLESLVNDMGRLYGLVADLAQQPGRIAEGALKALRATLEDLLGQAQAYAQALVQDARARVNALTAALDAVLAQVKQLEGQSFDAVPTLPGLPAALDAARAAAQALRTTADAKVNGVGLPDGYRQSLLQAASLTLTLADSVGLVPVLLTQGKALYDALDAVVGHPNQLDELFADAAALKPRLQAISAAAQPLSDTVGSARLLEGAPRQVAQTALRAVQLAVDAVLASAELLELLTGDELTLRFDWNPVIRNWSIKAGDPPLFVANDPHGFRVAVEARVRKNGQSAPKLSVTCSLKSFDLVLIAPASFLELNFEKIEFRIDTAAKMDVDVLLTDIKFVGPLSFVETLRDLIPLDGFSDPPYLDISPKGVDAGFDLALPAIAIGVFNLSNLSLGAGFTVPFIGQPLAVRFNFCTREQPFNLSVCMFGGGGFFGITLDPSGIQIMEAAFEFGASVSVNLGVASGGVHVMAGIYFRMEKNACSLAGYFRMGGCVSVLGIVSISIEIYLELRYEFESGKCAGRATITIEIEVFMFSMSVSLSCERKFAGSNGDPGFRDLMGPRPDLPLAQELAQIDDDTEYAWREYAEAFA